MPIPPDPNFTHVPILVRAVSMSVGPVIELGMGYYSTPVLSELCKVNNRTLISVENSQEWMDKFAALKTDNHEFILASNWEDVYAELSSRYRGIGTVFVDHAPGSNRAPAIRAFAHARFVVIHDTEPDSKHHYNGMKEAIDSFRYILHYNFFSVHTTIVSNYEEVRL